MMLIMECKPNKTKPVIPELPRIPKELIEELKTRAKYDKEDTACEKQGPYQHQDEQPAKDSGTVHRRTANRNHIRHYGRPPLQIGTDKLRTICHTNPTSYMTEYALYDAKYPDMPCDMKNLTWYLEHAVQHVTGKKANYAGIMAVQSIRAYCRSLTYQDFEVQLMIREPNQPFSYPEGIVIAQTDTTDPAAVSPLTNVGFTAYSPTTCILYL